MVTRGKISRPLENLFSKGLFAFMKKYIKKEKTMKLYDELVARGLIAQVTDEAEIKELIKKAKVITIASSPFFIEQDYAIKVLKELFNYDIIEELT